MSMGITHLESVWNPSGPSEFRGPLLLKPVTGQELFFAVSYSKPALAKEFILKFFAVTYKSQTFAIMGSLCIGS